MLTLPRLRRLGLRLRRDLLDRRGATAVEFAIIGAPFVLMIFAIIATACYYSGNAGSAVEMRAFYRWQLLTPFLTSLQTFAGGVAELQSAEVFQVEPNGQVNPGAKTC